MLIKKSMYIGSVASTVFDFHCRNTDDTPYTNLKRLLGQELVPKAGADGKSQDTQSDIECGICYAYKILHPKHSHQVPDAVCANYQCNRGFHPYCLYEVWITIQQKLVTTRTHHTALLQWLRSNPTTTRSFNVLFGNCPYCNEVCKRCLWYEDID